MIERYFVAFNPEQYFVRSYLEQDLVASHPRQEKDTSILVRIESSESKGDDDDADNVGLSQLFN